MNLIHYRRCRDSYPMIRFLYLNFIVFDSLYQYETLMFWFITCAWHNIIIDSLLLLKNLDCDSLHNLRIHLSYMIRFGHLIISEIWLIYNDEIYTGWFISDVRKFHRYDSFSCFENCRSALTHLYILIFNLGLIHFCTIVNLCSLIHEFVTFILR
jgi:hypothetical protein